MFRGVCAKPGSQESLTAALAFTVFVIFLLGCDPATSGITALERFDGAFAVTADMGSSKEVEGNGVSCALRVAAHADDCVTTVGRGLIVVGIVTTTFDLRDRSKSPQM